MSHFLGPKNSPLLSSPNLQTCQASLLLITRDLHLYFVFYDTLTPLFPAICQSGSDVHAGSLKAGFPDLRVFGWRDRTARSV